MDRNVHRDAAMDRGLGLRRDVRHHLFHHARRIGSGRRNLGLARDLDRRGRNRRGGGRRRSRGGHSRLLHFAAQHSDPGVCKGASDQARRNSTRSTAALSSRLPAHRSVSRFWRSSTGLAGWPANNGARSRRTVPAVPAGAPARRRRSRRAAAGSALRPASFLTTIRPTMATRPAQVRRRGRVDRRARSARWQALTHPRKASRGHR